MNEPIVIKAKKSKMLLLEAGALIFILLSLGMIFLDFGPESFFGGMVLKAPGGKFFAILCLLFFGAAFYFIAKKILQDKAALIVDQNGITDNSSAASLGFVPWKDIEGIGTFENRGLKFISVKIKNEDEYLNKLSSLKRNSILMSKDMGGEIMNITLIGSGFSAEELLPKIQEFFNKSKS